MIDLQRTRVPQKAPVTPLNDGAIRRNYTAARVKRVGKLLKSFATDTRGSVIRMKGAVGSRSACGMPKKAGAS
jgi:hypothetical protein